MNNQLTHIDVFIIGNGFDLAHGLKTKYTDFFKKRKRGVRNDPSLDNFLCEGFHSYSEQKGDHWFNLEEGIYELICRLLSLKSSLMPIRHKLCLSDEEMDKDAINALEKGYNKLVREDNNFQESSKKMYEQLRYLVKEINDSLKEISKDIEKRAKAQAWRLPLELPLEKNTQYQVHKIRVLNFNYTKTFEKLYDKRLIENGIADIKHYHIHGVIKENGSPSDKMNLVLGTQSFPGGNDKDLFRFTKYWQRHFYGTIEDYHKLLEEIEHLEGGTVTFHIIGHSIDEADHSILKEVLCHSLLLRGYYINVYYHDEEAKERLIYNITEMIGQEDYVNKRVRFINQHNEQDGILRHLKPLSETEENA